MSISNNLYKNSALYVVTDISIKAIGFILLPFYTYLITPEDFGKIYILITLSNFLTVLGSLTIHSSISRFYFDCKSDNEVRLLYSKIVKFVFLFSLSFYLTIGLLLNSVLESFIKLDFFPYIFLSLLHSFLSIFYLLISSLMQAKQDAKRLSLLTIITSIVSILLTLSFVLFLNDKIFAYILALFVSSLLGFILFLFLSFPFFTFHTKLADVKPYLGYSISRLPIDLSAFVVSFADRIMLFELKGEKETGIYSVGYKLGQAIQIVFLAINKAFVPFAFEKMKQNNKEGLEEIAQNVFLLFTIYFFITVTAINFSKEIISLLSKSYQDSYYVLILIILSYLLIGIKLLFQIPMDYNVKYVKIKSFLWMLVAFLNISLNILLIPKYSFVGAALATFISYLLVLLPIFYFSNRALKINYEIKKMLLVVLISIFSLTQVLMSLNITNFTIKLLLTIVYFFILIKISNISVFSIINLFMRKRNG